MFHPLIAFKQDDEGVRVERTAETKKASAMHGMARSIAANMVVGVHEGFERKLELIGVGYRASVKGTDLSMQLGYMCDSATLAESCAGVCCATHRDVSHSNTASHRRSPEVTM